MSRHVSYRFPYRHPPPEGVVEKLLYGVGTVARMVGGALDEYGTMLMGSSGVTETVQPNLAWAPSKHDPASPPSKGQVVPVPQSRRLTSLKTLVMPKKAENVFVAPSANVIGDVKIGPGSSVWYGACLRGDVNGIEIGPNTNIQDNVVIHVSRHSADGSARPTVIGSNSTIGHGAVVHAATVGDNSLVGMGATLLDGVVVESGAIVAAGAVVTPKTVVKSGEVWAGSPAKFLRKLSAEEQAFIGNSAENYAELANEHRFENSKSFEELYVESRIELERYLGSDPINSVHQMWEFDRQTMLATRPKK